MKKRKKMRKVVTLAGIVFITCVYQGGWGATWYVNGSASEFGDGTSPDKPLETIQDPLKIRASRG
jgi:hypothetical protein